MFALALFLLVQAIGLATAYRFNQLVGQGVLEPAFQNPQDPGNSLVLFAYILAVTGIVILIIRLRKRLLVLVEAMAVFLASDIVFELLIPVGIMGVSVGPFLALALTLWKIRRPTPLSQNTALVLSVSGAGALLGASMGILPVLVLMLALSAYDFVSVFLTKHMVYMAKAITERPMAFTASIPCQFKKPVKVKDVRSGKTLRKKVHVFQLGGGDFAIPLVFTSSVLTYASPVHALAAAAGAAVSLVLLFEYVTRRPGNVLPALPPLCAGASIGFVLAAVALG